MATNTVVQDWINNGKVVAVGEWRGVTAETIEYISKKTGKKEAFSRLVHVVELGSADGSRTESIKVTESIPEGETLEGRRDRVLGNLKKGGRVAIEVDSMEVALGNKSMRAAQMISI
jgi:hypothetical protein